MPLETLQQQRAELEQGWLAENSRKGYRHDWGLFERWCAEVGRTALPATPDTASLFLTFELARGRRVATAVRRASAIQRQHRAAGYPPPITESIWGLLIGAKRIRRERPRQVLPLTVDQLRAISEVLAADRSWLAIRDRCILVLGFASALRRSSLAELRLDELGFGERGVEVFLRHEKTDQEGRGRTLALPFGQHAATCPVLALADWIRIRGGWAGPLFVSQTCQRLTGAAIGRVVKRSVKRIGLDEGLYCGHSLRAGWVTAAGEHGLSLLAISQQTGHKSMDVLRRYFRRQEAWAGAAATRIL